MTAERPPARRRRPRRLRARLAAPAGLLLLAAALHLTTRGLDSVAASPAPLAPPVPWEIARRLPPPPDDAGRLEVGRPDLPVPLELRRGGTLAGALAGAGMEAAEIHSLTTRLVESLGEKVDPRKLPPGGAYFAHLDAAGRVRAVELAVDGEGVARLERHGAGWRGHWQPYRRWSRRQRAVGELRGSLEGSIVAAGGEPMLAYRMAEVLQWDLDFNRDLRLGDRFAVLYESEYVEGRPHSVGPVLALSYENLGRRLEAYRWGEEPGYYDGEGRPLQKMFLRSPLPYSRVTSRFSRRRFHPVLQRYRPHYGVDYGAPVGTAARVTASGVVTFAGWDRGGGNMVKVRHPNGYLTAYLHLSRFASGVRPGVRVRQGQTIGYVGATGLATGPHLDYRVQRDGRWIDPLTIRSVPADPIPEADLPAFLARRDEMRAALAAAESPPSDRRSGVGGRAAP